jgi:hypothetical protein
MLGDAIISHMSDIENGLIKIMYEISFSAAVALSHYNFSHFYCCLIKFIFYFYILLGEADKVKTLIRLRAELSPLFTGKRNASKYAWA